MLIQASMHCFLFLRVHCQGKVYLLSNTRQVPGIDVYCVLQTSGCPREFRKDEWPMIVSLAHNIFQNGRVHSVTNASNQANVCSSKKGKIFLLREVLRVVLN